MKTMSGVGVAVVFLSAAMACTLVGRAEKQRTDGQQDSGQKEKHRAELAFLVRPDNEAGDDQTDQQKVTLQLIAAEAEVVKGKPYSADTSTETVQTLPDGNRIAHRTESRFYRDSEGRTRREQTFGNIDPEHPSPHEVKTFIEDPVSGTAFVLDPGSKSAEKMQRFRKILDERNAQDDGTKIMFKSIDDREQAGQSPAGRMMLKFRDEHAGNPNILTTTTDDKRDVQKEDLGTRNIEGLDCNGTRQTTTIPAGAIGNEKPISIVTEIWFAPAIGTVVLSTSDDPRYGKTTYQLANVQLNEPQRSLFEPPADFKVSVRR